MQNVSHVVEKSEESSQTPPRPRSVEIKTWQEEMKNSLTNWSKMQKPQC